MNKLFVVFLFYFVSSCSGVEFVYKNDRNLLNPLYQKTKVITSQKTRNNIHILYKDGTFCELDEPLDYKQGIYDDLKHALVLNVKKLDVYELDLQPIGKYKVTELVELANKVDLPIEANGKKKVKKQLYDELYLYYLNQTN